MIRAVIVVLGAILLSGLLAALVGFVVASGADTQLMLDMAADHEAGGAVAHQEADAVWEALERGRFRDAWIYCPAIVLLVGSFVGLTSRSHAWQLALAGIAPFAVIFSVGTRGVPSGLPFLSFYLAVGAVSAWTTSLLLSRMRAPQPS
jgi:hypothetical protein